jgi:trehalose synthase
MLTVDTSATSAAAELGELIGTQRYAQMRSAADRIGDALDGGMLWHVNSTPAGGGVAEMLQTLIPLYRDLGVRARWAVITGSEEFFRITKRLGLGLYGDPGDGDQLGSHELALYTAALREAGERLLAELKPEDVVILHDHQTGGLVELLRPHVRAVYWRGHVGVDAPNRWSDRAWDFLAPQLRPANGLLFSVGWHAPRDRVAVPITVLQPFISPSAPKNCDLDPQDTGSALANCGLNPQLAAGERVVRTPKGPVMLRSKASVVSEAPPEPGQPLLAQVSRWDRLKDMHGVLDAFISSGTDGYLALVGPDPTAIPDDTEAAQWYARAVSAWRALPATRRRTVAIVCLPMDNLDENAVLVNAVQRAADVVLQKSLAEGFGLTVAEAMWKSRPVVASAVGGIRVQIDHGESGLLAQPGDPGDFAALMARAVADGTALRRMGERARARVHLDFLPDREVQVTSRLLTGHGEDVTAT